MSMDSLDSSKNRPDDPLASVSAMQAELFLLELANLQDKPEAVERFQRMFKDFLPGSVGYAKRGVTKNKAAEDFQADYPLPEDLWRLRNMVQRIWREPDLRTQEWLVFLLRRNELIASDSRFGAPEAFNVHVPPPTRFELCLRHMLRSADRLRYCQNDGCLTPYFIARRRSQKYCSDACALPAQRKFKLRWWSEHGSQWRKRHSKSKSRKRR
jgi:predicted RNA-binding Zn ribbon-like protein